ncbi:hypothetical protein FJU08_06220 [Martelella alba]|uniref:Uncharacterized protein n=1 Tax=Martelella alba TaxID=2590451 RepID=A0A506UDR7_9HYPH|nr:hypothetical protein FJU08_06220 [Martelella alba]
MKTKSTIKLKKQTVNSLWFVAGQREPIVLLSVACGGKTEEDGMKNDGYGQYWRLRISRILCACFLLAERARDMVSGRRFSLQGRFGLPRAF